MTEPTGHSPLGASGASRWMKCPGSIGLSRGIQDPESDFAAEGTAAHALAEYCLAADFDAWAMIGAHIKGDNFYPAPVWDETIGGVLVDKDMADAVQVYLGAVREWHPDRNQGNTWIEKRFHCPTIHKYFYGTSDLVHLDMEGRTLYVWDYKHGAGIVVNAKDNPQTMYYACGVLEELDLWDKVDKVVLFIAQPRGFHFDGPVRYWTVETPALVEWLEDVLIPAMDKALTSRDTLSGDHCRFCPARGYACPQLISDMDELEVFVNQMKTENGAQELTNEQVGRFLDLFDVAKIVNKAAEETAFMRLNSGKEIPGRKLGQGRVNREWKPGAEEELKKKYGKKAYSEPALKSPAQIDAMPEGSKYSERYAFKPEGALRVIKATDARPAINKSTKSLFKAQPKGKK